MQKTALGPVVYDAEKCMGCRYCMQACPFQVPSYEWDSRLPRMRKCDMCYERQSQGKPTACAEACPVGATICGERDDWLAEARKRIAEKPDRYYGQDLRRDRGRRHVSVLYLSAVPFEQIGLRTSVPQEPLPETPGGCWNWCPTWFRPASVLLGGIWWITNRRAEVAQEGGPP